MQHDNHVIPFIKAKFGITVELSQDWYGPREFVAFRGDWDLDIKYTYGDTVFQAALEYAAAYDVAFDWLCAIETGV